MPVIIIQSRTTAPSALLCICIIHLTTGRDADGKPAEIDSRTGLKNARNQGNADAIEGQIMSKRRVKYAMA